MLKKQQYAFSVAASSAGVAKQAKSVAEEEEDESRGGDEDTFVNNYFDKSGGGKELLKQQQQLRRKLADETDYDFQEDEEFDHFSRAGKGAPRSHVQVSSGFLKHKRPKPDLGDEDDHDEPSYRVRGLPVHLPAKAPAKEVPMRFSKRQKDLDRLPEDATEKRAMQLNRRFELTKLEQLKSKQDDWMKRALEGAKRSQDDRGPLGGTTILRKEILSDAAPEHTTGKRIRHNQFLHFDGSFYAGRFYLDPQGSKPSETCTRDMTLLLYVDKTGPEGLLLRIDKKYYELFEGDVGFVQSESVYSIVNPSRSSKCTVTYTLVANPADEEEQDLGEEEAQAGKSRPVTEAEEKELLEYELAWKKNKTTKPKERTSVDEDDRRSEQ